MNNFPNDHEGMADEQAALYAAGAMTPDERARFESRLERDGELRSALAAYDSACEALVDQIEPVAPDDGVLQSLLSQIDEEDTESDAVLSRESEIVIHRADASDWEETGNPGVTMRVLNTDARLQRMTALMRMEAGAAYPAHAHDQDEECLMLEGDLDFGDYVLEAGDYLRMAAGTEHGIARSRSGCVCLITTALPDTLVA